jgi:hypothetical protein
MRRHEGSGIRHSFFVDGRNSRQCHHDTVPQELSRSRRIQFSASGEAVHPAL